MDQWIRDFLKQFGAPGVGVLMLVENVFPPIPSEIMMPRAGYSVSQGQTSFFAVVLAGSVGSFAGAMLWYYLARWIGKDRLARLIDGHGAWLTITPHDLDRVDDWFNRWGPFAVLGCRLIPGVRTFISIPAGFSDMPIGKFSFLTAIGTVAWTALLAGVGWWLRDNYGDLAGPLGWVSSIVVAGLFLWWLVRVIQQRLSRQPSSQVGGQD